jgi:hypothetical protein
VATINAFKTILNNWISFGMTGMHLILDFGAPMSWMSFTAIWIAAICIVDSQELNVRNVVMSICWHFLASGGTFALPATRREWSNTASGC